MSDDSQLAVLLRRLAWAIDDAIREIPGLTDERKTELVGILIGTAEYVRRSMKHPVVDGPSAAESADEYAQAQQLQDFLASLFGYEDRYGSAVLATEAGTQVGVYVKDLRSLISGLATR